MGVTVADQASSTWPCPLFYPGKAEAVTILPCSMLPTRWSCACQVVSLPVLLVVLDQLVSLDTQPGLREHLSTSARLRMVGAERG